MCWKRGIVFVYLKCVQKLVKDFAGIYDCYESVCYQLKIVLLEIYIKIPRSTSVISVVLVGNLHAEPLVLNGDHRSLAGED